MYVSPEHYNNYAHALHSQEWLIKIAEGGLVALFGAHIILALTTDRDNKEARPDRYAVTQTNRKDRFLPAFMSPENMMFLSGIIVLVFLIWHLFDFALGIRLTEFTAGKEPFEKAMIILQNPLSAGIYIVGTLVLGWHLVHAFASAFRTLGWNHPKYNTSIKMFSRILAVVVALGFCSFPIWANLMQPKRELKSNIQESVEKLETANTTPANAPVPHN